VENVAQNVGILCGGSTTRRRNLPVSTPTRESRQKLVRRAFISSLADLRRVLTVGATVGQGYVDATVDGSVQDPVLNTILLMRLWYYAPHDTRSFWGVHTALTLSQRHSTPGMHPMHRFSLLYDGRFDFCRRFGPRTCLATILRVLD
jgi:hypothetical protein